MRAGILSFGTISPVFLLALVNCTLPIPSGGNEGGSSADAGATAIEDAGAAAPTAADTQDAAAPVSDSGTVTVMSAPAPVVDAGSPSSSPAPAPAADAGADAAAAPSPPITIASSPVSGLHIDHDLVVDGLPSDRFTWIDASGTNRSAVLAHNDGGASSAAGGSHGGELREMDYVVGGSTRVVKAPPTSFGGFGYVVGHRSEGTDGIRADDSPLGHFFPGTWTRIFEGENHAIFRFTQTYPRYSRTDASPPNTEYDVPVTIDWVFSTGHDAPLWSVTYDLSSVPANAVDSDSRAPYGEMLIDGSSSLDSHSVIAGVGWGDRYKFTTTGGPVTLGSAWTWDQPNTVPYVDIWTSAIDATMGIVQTQTMAEHEAGGYWGIDRWTTTSAAGNACTEASGGIDSSMPCAYNWPYQSVQYAFNDTTTPTNDPRLAWGTEFGYLGQTAYSANGSQWYGGPDQTHTDSGWPRQSYSTYIVMGTKTGDPVAANVSAVEAMQTVTSTATLGSVATSGPAGIGRADTITYSPAGYDPIYGALTYGAASNALDVNLSIGSGTLSRPLVIVRNWTGGNPSSIRLDGTTLTAGTDAYVSVRPDANELWVTFARDLSGSSHRVQIAGHAQAD